MKRLVIFVLFSIVVTQVQAKLLISPTRLSFAPNERTKEVILINTTTVPLTYRMEWKDMIPLAGGGYQEIKEGEELPLNSAQSILRFSPRQVTLQPGQRQVIKVLATRRPNFDLAEYRSHFNFIVIPPEITESANNSTQGISISLNLFTNYSIPVVVRNANTDAKISVSQAQLSYDPETERSSLKVELAREGSQSFYGKMRVHELEGNKKRLIGQLNGINLFAPLTSFSRTIFLPDYDGSTNNKQPLLLEVFGDEEYADVPKVTFQIK